MAPVLVLRLKPAGSAPVLMENALGAGPLVVTVWLYEAPSLMVSPSDARFVKLGLSQMVTWYEAVVLEPTQLVAVMVKV
jgi:hypothetical protein